MQLQWFTLTCYTNLQYYYVGAYVNALYGSLPVQQCQGFQCATLQSQDIGPEDKCIAVSL